MTPSTMTTPPVHVDTDLKSFFGRYLRSWPIVAVTGIFLLALVVLIILNVQPSYSGSTSIVILTPMRHDDPNRMVQPKETAARTDKNYYLNEQLRITSQPIISRVVEKLKLRTKYVQEGLLLDWDMYKDSPILVELDTSSVHNSTLVPYGVAFYLHGVRGDDFQLVGDGTYGPDKKEIDVNQPAKFGEWIALDAMRVRISKAPNAKLPLEGPGSYRYGFVQYDPHQVTLTVMASLTAEPGVAEATTVNVTYTAAPRAKTLDILNAIGAEYTAVHLAEQQQDLDRTIATVQQEIVKNNQQLSTLGDRLESFKEGENITNLDHSTILMQENVASLDTRWEALSVQFKYYDNLSKQLRSGDEAKPSSPKAFSITDPLLNDMTASYAKLQSDVAMLRKEGKTANPSYNRMLKMLDQQRENLLNSVESFRENTRINMQNLDAQRKELQAKQSAVPKLDRLLMDRERDQRTQETVTSGLMARLSDLNVQRAALTPEVSVITPAYLTNLDPAFPNIVLLLAAAVLLALMAPLVYMVAKSMLSGKITGAGDLAKALPDAHIASTVPYSSNLNLAKFTASTKSEATIEIAKLAAWLEQQGGNPPQVIHVCGTNGSESSGLLASRLAWMLAHRGKKVLLVRDGGAPPIKAALPQGLSIALMNGNDLGGIKQKAGTDGTDVVVVEGSSADMLAIAPYVGKVDQALVVCQPGKTTKDDLEKLATTRANGQLPPVVLVLDGVKDKALPWFGLARKNGEQRLGFCRFFRYNWSRAVS
ncbi:MAG: hypothetical protein JST45_04625 [Bacteroidetes bacterium]|nr:hypothetical protein [Bacteroidota bacterium]